MTISANHFCIIAISAGMLSITSCSDSPETKGDHMEDRMESIHEEINEVEMVDRKEFEKERQEILGALRDLRADINDDLSDSEKELAEADIEEDDRMRQERLKKELEHQRTTIDRHIEIVEGAVMSDWDHVRTATRDILIQADLLYDREELERSHGITGGAGTYDLQHVGDGTVNTNRDLNLDDNKDDEVR